MPRELSEAETLALLASRRRRTTLQILATTDTPVTTSQLAERIADRETDSPDGEYHRTVESALTDDHLPPLEDAAVVTRDEAAGTVDTGPNFPTVFAALENVSERDLPWSDE